MMIPYGINETYQEKYNRKVRNRMTKAQHLSERIKLFIEDIEKSTLKEKDKSKIKNELLKQLEELRK